MTDLLARVPDVVWAAIGGSAMTLLGVWLQSHAESKRQQDRLVRESTERRRERDLQLRRDLYVQAADSAFRAQKAFMQLADVNKPVAELGSSIDPVELGGLSKAHLVGRLETIKALDDVSFTIADQLLDLLDARLKVEVAKADYEQQSRAVCQLQSYRDHFVGAIRHVEGGIGFGTPQVDTYMNQVDEIQNQLQAASPPLELARLAFEKAQRDLMLKSMGTALTYGAALARANVAVRAELDQIEGFDVSAYEKHIAESAARVSGAWQTFFARWTG